MVAVVRWDTAEGEIDELAQKLTQRLLKEGVVSTNSKRDELWQPSEWMPGPRWRDVVEEGSWNEFFIGTANIGVDVEVERQVHHPVETMSRPRAAVATQSFPPTTTRSNPGWLGMSRLSS